MLRSSHTHLQTATSPRTDQSLQKSVSAQPKKKFIFFLPSLRCFNFFTYAQPTTDKHFDSSGHKQKVVQLDTEDRTPSANMGLASCGVKCLNSSVVFQINFCAGLTVLCPEIPHERQAQKRYRKL